MSMTRPPAGSGGAGGPGSTGRGAMALPQGVEIASYATYLEAQRAVDHLSDEEFPVQHTSIVGTDLRSVEKVLGRLTYGTVALRGALSGAWFGLFVGLLLSLLGGAGLGSSVLAAILIGAAFGILFGVVSHAATRGQRDFTAVNTIMASRYAVVCSQEVDRARSLLENLDGVRDLGGPGAGAL